MEKAYQFLRDEQERIRTEDSEEPLLFKPGDLVWLVNKWTRKGQNPKLQAKYVGSYAVVEGYTNHTYKIWTNLQSEGRLTLHQACVNAAGRAQVVLEPTRKPNMRGTTRQNPRREERELL